MFVGEDGLEIALARPLMYAHYQAADIALQAAALAHGIAESQPFIDGNKRTAELAFLAFLEENGFHLLASESSLAGWIHALSANLTVEELAERIRACLVKP